MAKKSKKAKSKKPEDELALLALVQELLVKHGPSDEHWLWSRYNPFSLLNALKQKLSDDTQECNDSIEMGSEISPGDLAVATLAPEGLDVEYYWIPVPLPDDQSPPQPARPITLKFNQSDCGHTP